MIGVQVGDDDTAKLFEAMPLGEDGHRTGARVHEDEAGVSVEQIAGRHAFSRWGGPRSEPQNLNQCHGQRPPEPAGAIRDAIPGTTETRT